jgi:hypothetical protein
MNGATTTKAKKLIKKTTVIQGNEWRPVTVTLNANFPKEHGRKVTPADLEKAAAAAAAAFRAALEARTPAYQVLDLTANVNYSYTMVNTTQKL